MISHSYKFVATVISIGISQVGKRQQNSKLANRFPFPICVGESLRESLHDGWTLEAKENSDRKFLRLFVEYDTERLGVDAGKLLERGRARLAGTARAGGRASRFACIHAHDWNRAFALRGGGDCVSPFVRFRIALISFISVRSDTLSTVSIELPLPTLSLSSRFCTAPVNSRTSSRRFNTDHATGAMDRNALNVSCTLENARYTARADLYRRP